MLAVVGPSGAGKTSLIDVLLGVIAPTKGSIQLSGLMPEDAVQRWPGAIAYVPQDISIVRGTIATNVALGFDLSEIDENRIWEALEIAQLKSFVEGLPEGINSTVGERGSKLSGGQRQRLGIARALLSSPKLLVLDEATSALDGKSEIDVSDAISKLKNSMTLVVIAHRLSTVRNADLVIYMDSGKIVASGTFDEVRKAVPDFDMQAKLMGI
jgi:ABC-type multidrug transport system fused ATPase/permease subunit